MGVASSQRSTPCRDRGSEAGLLSDGWTGACTHDREKTEEVSEVSLSGPLPS